jgi:hypothetical protein
MIVAIYNLNTFGTRHYYKISVLDDEYNDRWYNIKEIDPILKAITTKLQESFETLIIDSASGHDIRISLESEADIALLEVLRHNNLGLTLDLR